MYCTIPWLGYTYKCIGSGFWATRYGTNFRTSITELVLEGGDADTNGAVAGAMLGCKLGFKALPKVTQVVDDVGYGNLI